MYCYVHPPPQHSDGVSDGPAGYSDYPLASSVACVATAAVQHGPVHLPLALPWPESRKPRPHSLRRPTCVRARVYAGVCVRVCKCVSANARACVRARVRVRARTEGWVPKGTRPTDHDGSIATRHAENLRVGGRPRQQRIPASWR